MELQGNTYMDEPIILFGKANAIKDLQRFNARLTSIDTDDPFDKPRNHFIQIIVESMIATPEQWNTHCSVNAEWIGSYFIEELSLHGENFTKEKLDDVYSMCFRFILELNLSIKNDLAIEYKKAYEFAFENLESFSPNAQSQIEFAIKFMPIAIVKQVINGPDFNALREYKELSSKANSQNEKIAEDLDERESRAEKLRVALSEYETGFNFVGLFQGFDELSEQKEKEKNKSIFWLKIFGFLIIAPIFLQLWIILPNIQKLEIYTTAILISLIPGASLMVIFIYYFRILLQNYKSIQSQLLQIELRKTLCRFIQSYSDYASDLKKQDSDSLAKFENIIFSGIVTDEGKIPTTFDGFEQLGNLLKSAKS